MTELFDETVEVLLERVKKAEPGSKEEQTSADAAAKLARLQLDEYEVANRMEFERKKLELEESRLELERERLEIEKERNVSNDLWNKAFGIGTEVAKIGMFAAGQKLLSKRWTDVLLLESTGTFGTEAARRNIPRINM